MDIFKQDSVTLAEKGNWNLVIYAKRAVSLLSKDGSEIKSLGCCVADDESGRISDESILIDQLGDLYLEQLRENERLSKLLSEDK